MRWPAPDSFRAQVAVIGLASLSMAALAVILVRDVLTSTEQTLLREARQQCTTAVKELGEQFAESARLREEPLELLPFEAQDLSLTGLSATVLRPYEGVAGGFLLAGRVAGYANPSGAIELTEAERRLIKTLGARAVAQGRTVADGTVRGRDLIVAAARAIEPGGSTAWTLKRLTGVRDPVVMKRRWWLAGLVLSALLGLLFIISISIRLRRGVSAVNEGLQRLEEDFTYRMPQIGGDFGEIAKAIDQMAERRMALEMTLRRQDRLAALGKVVAGVAHEIRNPLNSIRLTLELLNRRVRKGSASGEEVEGAIAEVDRLDRILARLLAFGRPESEQREVQDIRPLVGRAVKMVREQSQRKNIQVVVGEQGSEPLEADVDGLQVEQVLINLLLNAIEASQEGALVRVDAEKEDGLARVGVHDDGPGIPEPVREHVFDPYFTTKEAGNGLGLAVSREVVARHGGTLEFESNGQGTTFVMRLPLHRSSG